MGEQLQKKAMGWTQAQVSHTHGTTPGKCLAHLKLLRILWVLGGSWLRSSHCRHMPVAGGGNWVNQLLVLIFMGQANAEFHHERIQLE